MSTCHSERDRSMSPGLKSLLLIAFFTAVACTSGTVKPQRGDLFSILCETLVADEELSSKQEVFVLDETRPVYQLSALHMVFADQGLTPDQVEPDLRRDQELSASFQPQPVSLSANTTRCNWKITSDDMKSLRRLNRLVVEVSNPVQSSFGRESSSHGRFVRFSVGGRSGAAWYWVPLSNEDDGWFVNRPVKLPVSDS